MEEDRGRLFERSISLGTLAIASLSIVITLVVAIGGPLAGYLIGNSERVTKLDTEFHSAVAFGNIRNGRQDDDIRSAQRDIANVQVSLGQLLVRLDTVTQQLSQIAAQGQRR